MPLGTMPFSLLSPVASELLLPFVCPLIHLQAAKTETKSLLYRIQLIAWVNMEKA